MSKHYAAALDAGNRVLTILFILECASKMGGLGFWGFWNDPFNRFDLLFAGLGLVEMVEMVRERFLHVQVTPICWDGSASWLPSCRNRGGPKSMAPPAALAKHS